MRITTNILVVGAGVSGIAAAVAASRQGKQVVLIDNHSYPGGAATAVEVGTICGLYYNGKDVESMFMVDGFVQEFALRTADYSKTTPNSNQYGLHYLPYNKEELKRLIEDYITENNILFLSECLLAEVTGDNTYLKKAVVLQKDRQLTIEFDAMIDCSGNATVAELSDHPLVENHYFQAASINFYIENSQIGDNELSNFKLIRDLKTIIQQQQLPDYFKNLFIIPGSQSREKIGFKFTIPWEVSHQKGEIERLTIRAKELVNELFYTLKQHSSLFTNARIDHIADDLGWRTGRRPLGKYILTEEDVVTARKWEHPIAKSSWPIEDWLPNKSVDLTFVKEDDYYEIPRECLFSATYDNLFFAGRIISASDRAIASARVMGVCLQTGYAAGMLAARISAK